MTPTIKSLTAELKRLGHVVFETGRYNLNIVGIRTKNAKAGKFDDLMCVFFKDDTDQWVLKTWKCTTDPGVYWLQNPTRTAGTAILCPGQYRSSFTLGKHKGAYEALVQYKTLKVFRDNNKDEVLDYVNPEDGFFGINIHRANSAKESVVVDKWSAGCQVFARPDSFEAFLNLYKKSAQLYGPTVTYTLIEEF